MKALMMIPVVISAVILVMLVGSMGMMLMTARAQDEGQPQAPVVIPQGEPQWIVVYRIPKQDNREGMPFTDLRLVIYAKNEATAIYRSVMFLKDIFPDWIMRAAEFIEAVPRKPDTQDRK